MNCYVHPNEEAISTCSQCEAGLCFECDTKYDTPMCDNCKAEAVKNRRIKFALGVIAGMIVVGIGIFNGERSPGMIIFFIAAFSLTRGFEDFKLAYNTKVMQGGRNKITEMVANEKAQGKTGINSVIGGNFVLYAVFFPWYLVWYGLGSFFREIKGLISDTKESKLIGNN